MPVGVSEMSRRHPQCLEVAPGSVDHAALSPSSGSMTMSHSLPLRAVPSCFIHVLFMIISALHMKFLFFLIIILSTLCHSLPPYKDRRSDSGQPWVRRTRSNPPSQDTLNNKRGTTVLGFKIKIPKFIRSMSISVKEFFFGPSGVVTKVKDFLSGNSKVSTRVFGTKIDFQANVPLSKEDVGKSFSSFLRKFRTDPMTRVLFVMYLNVV
ncbi:hypothetical protein Y032_0048g1682 [Ancylostoma ceylanicum]|nr:hypothetical protein Y032_0048g1682 [Ancylostoma ceylanicum]